MGCSMVLSIESMDSASMLLAVAAQHDVHDHACISVSKPLCGLHCEGAKRSTPLAPVQRQAGSSGQASLGAYAPHVHAQQSIPCRQGADELLGGICAADALHAPGAAHQAGAGRARGAAQPAARRWQRAAGRRAPGQSPSPRRACCCSSSGRPPSCSDDNGWPGNTRSGAGDGVTPRTRHGRLPCSGGALPQCAMAAVRRAPGRRRRPPGEDIEAAAGGGHAPRTRVSGGVWLRA